MTKFDLEIKRNDPEFLAAVVDFLVAETGMNPNEAAGLHASWLNMCAASKASGTNPQSNAWIPPSDAS